jgi:hypothetical protein
MPNQKSGKQINPADPKQTDAFFRSKPICETQEEILEAVDSYFL